MTRSLIARPIMNTLVAHLCLRSFLRARLTVYTTAMLPVGEEEIVNGDDRGDGERYADFAR